MNATSTRSYRSGRLIVAALLLLGVLLSAAPTRALAGGEFFDGTVGTNPPPPTLGPWTMLPFAADPTPVFDDVSVVAGPTGDLVFSAPCNHRMVGSGWGTWSHGYTGDVYYSNEATSVTITLPPNTMAFYFYVEPNPFVSHPITAVTGGGTSSGAVPVDGDSGATYFGFYSTGSALTSVTISSDVDFAVGEFGIAAGSGAAPEGRANVSVLVYGGWSGIPVRAWVGGTQQPVLVTAPNHEGVPAVLFSFWPPAGSAWKVSATPDLPTELDPARWEYRLLGISTNGTWAGAPASGEVTVSQGTQIILYYQLYDKGAALPVPGAAAVPDAGADPADPEPLQTNPGDSDGNQGLS